jgi:hypothetical protein
MEGYEILTRQRRRSDFAGAISFGAFLILLAVFYVTSPSLPTEVRSFLGDFKTVEISQDFRWLEPSSNHPMLYGATERFCYLFGLVQVAILGLELAKRSTVREKARTFSSLIFWLGAGYSFGILSSGRLTWIPFLGVLIIFGGVSMVMRSAILVIASRR